MTLRSQICKIINTPPHFFPFLKEYSPFKIKIIGDDVQNQHGRPDDAFPDGRPETKKNSDDGGKTPVGCRPKFL
jgi:hypothetical protein